MKRLTSTLLAATLVAGLMGSTANAQSADYDQMLNTVQVGLASLQVDTSRIALLGDEDLAKLTAVLDSNDSNEVKAQNANLIIEDALMPTTLDMTTGEGLRLRQELAQKLSVIGVVLPVDQLNYDQTQQLIANINRHPKDVDRARMAVEAVFKSFTNPADTTTAASNEGLTQEQDAMSVQLGALGITPPATLTQEQIAQLNGVFNNNESQESKKAAAMKILGL